ncbi:MAG: Tll0287-like domain-containing protein [Gemmatimonadota bacterium]
MMKQSVVPGHLFLSSFLVLALLIGCAPSEEDDGGARTAENGLIPTETRQAVVDLGSEAAGELGAKLIGRLQSKLAEEGPAEAVEFCSVEGLPLTAEVSREIGFEVKRTSSRIRNPANAPDSLERAALDHFEEAAAAGDSLPSAFVQRTAAEDYRHYQPLRVQPFCVQCHGSRDDLGEGVAEILEERYPDDAATGYSAGDFRGLIRVTVPASAVERRSGASESVGGGR